MTIWIRIVATLATMVLGTGLVVFSSNCTGFTNKLHLACIILILWGIWV